MPRYERDEEFREVTVEGTSLRTVSGGRGLLRRKKSESKEFESAVKAKLAFVQLTRELREDGFVCVEDARAAPSAVEKAARSGYAELLERAVPDVPTTAEIRAVLPGLYAIREGARAGSRAGVFGGLDAEPRIRAWEAAMVAKYGGPLGLVELETRENFEQLIVPPPEDFAAVTNAFADRAVRGLYNVAKAQKEGREGTFFPNTPHLLAGLEPAPLLASWQDKLTNAYGDVGLSFFAEVSQDYSVTVPDAVVRTNRRRGTFKAEPPPRSGLRANLAGDDDEKLAALSTRLLDDPTDGDVAAVYADRLQELGNPLGELMIECIEAEKKGGSPNDAALEYLKRRGGAVLGSLFECNQAGVVLEWRAGLIREARIADPENEDLFAVLESLLEAPAAAFLSALTLGIMGDLELDYESAIALIADSGPHPALRSLFLGDFVRDEIEMSWAIVGDVSPLWKACPALRSLALKGSDISLGQINSSQLERLALRSGGLPLEAVESVVNADWPSLIELELWFGDSNYGAEATIEIIAPILSGARLPALKTLRLMNAEFADDIARELATSALLGRLEVVDLSMGILSDEGARSITASHGAFAHLKTLDLSDNFLSDAAVASFAAHPFVTTGEQKETDDDDYRYVTVGE